MNRQQFHNFDPQGCYLWEAFAFLNESSMLPMSVSMSSPPNDVRDVSDGRIHLQGIRRTDYATRSDGDIVVVQPSFDDSTERSKTPPLSSPVKQQEWQARSPDDDEKLSDKELRNPSSPEKAIQGSSHTRDLSAHFFDATSLHDNSSDQESDIAKGSEDIASRKHRRMFSDDLLNPNMAHRRINSIGNSAPVQRDSSRQRHQREDSAGLEILSAAANVSGEDLAAAAGVPQRRAWESRIDTQPPRVPMPQVSTESGSYNQPPPQLPPVNHPLMSPPAPPRRVPAPHASNSYPPPPIHRPLYAHGAHPHMPYAPPSPFSNYPPHSYYPPGYPSRTIPPPAHGYPVQYSQRPPQVFSKPMYPPQQRHRSKVPSESLEAPDHLTQEQVNRVLPQAGAHTRNEPSANTTHQGVQTFVTAISVGDSNKTMQPTPSQTAATSNASDGLRPNSVPMQISHHRKMSSFSSFGTFLGTSVLSPGGSETQSTNVQTHPLKSGHHRKTSSSLSFLQGMEVALDSTDESFLRNLQASHAALAESNSRSSTPVDEGTGVALVSSTKLAAGGTSKRVRRKCTVEGCTNRVVQGGLCISHGAKRKICNHPGCSKNVKKAGMCSTHGPARKRCDVEGCPKVAVQGGKCIAHGAKKKGCSYEDCTKQAILGGMCKKHHDQAQGIPSTDADSLEAPFCQEVSSATKPAASAAAAHKPSHTRGLSIFQEISADAVKSLLNEET